MSSYGYTWNQDGGCNGGLAGDDDVVLELSTQLVDITGIADSKIESVPISTVADLIRTTMGPIIGIFPQYAAYGKSLYMSLSSSALLFWFGGQ